jgi:hypothetical protein
MNYKITRRFCNYRPYTKGNGTSGATVESERLAGWLTAHTYLFPCLFGCLLSIYKYFARIWRQYTPVHLYPRVLLKNILH